jgi:signal transduction histidine kinase
VEKPAKADSLHGLLKARRNELLACWARKTEATIASADVPRGELLDQMPAFVDELIAALYPEAMPLPIPSATAVEHGAQRLRLGFDVGQVVREYGLLHECIIDLAAATGTAASARERLIVAKAINHGIADAVAQYVRQRDDELRRQSSEHVGFIAHELRNPLSAARLALARLQRTELAGGGRSVDLLERNLRRTAEMIESALAHSSLAMGVEPRRERIDVPAFLREIEQDVALEARARRIAVVTATPQHLTIDADRRLLRSAVTNLVTNALKFSHEDSSIEIIASRNDVQVMLDVADACGGLPPGRAEELFAPLVQRGDDRSGYGLGLAIARQAAEAHGGSISLRDVPGVGCVFTIVLPVGPTTAR